jgi:hypothetical protein
MILYYYSTPNTTFPAIKKRVVPKPYLSVIEQHIKEQPSITVTYFLPDDKKAGGRYVTVSGNVRKLDGLKRVIIMADRTKIPIEDVRYIEGELFQGFKQ